MPLPVLESSARESIVLSAPYAALPQPAQHAARWRLGVVGVLGLAFGLRFAGVTASLPWHDEINLVETALRLGSGTIQPFGLSHGTGLPLILFVVYGGYACWHWMIGSWSSPLQVAVAYVQNPAPFFVLGRAVVAMSGVLVVWETMMIGRRMFSASVGFMAGLMMSCALLAVSMSVQLKEDMPAVALLLAAYWLSLQCGGMLPSTRSPQRAAWWAGIALGAATAVKYSMVLGVSFLGLAIWHTHGQPALAHRRTRCAVRAALGCLGAFIALMPAAVLHPRLLLEGIRSVPMGYGLYAQHLAPWIVRVGMQLPESVGWPLYGLLILGMLVLVCTAGRVAGWLLLFPLLLMLLVGRWVGFAHHLLPALPFVFLAAAEGLRRLCRMVTTSATLGTLLAALLVMGCAYPTLDRTVRLLAVLRSSDTRSQAQAWIETHVPARASVLIEGAVSHEIVHGPRLANLAEGLEKDLHALQRTGARGALATVRLVAAQHAPARAYQLEKAHHLTLAALHDPSMAYVVVSGYFDQPLFSRDPQDVAELQSYSAPGFPEERRAVRDRLQRDFTLLARFVPGAYFHEGFPMLMLHDFRELRYVAVPAKAGVPLQGPLVEVYQRNEPAPRQTTGLR